MIQRIQTVFLALAVILNFAAFFTPIYEKAMQDPQMWIGYGLAISLLISIMVTLFSIFRYSNRLDQMSWVKRAMFPQVVAIGFAVGVLFSLGGIGTYLWDEALGTGLIVVAFIFQFFGLRFIKKDEDKVRSMDRIR